MPIWFIYLYLLLSHKHSFIFWIWAQVIFKKYIRSCHLLLSCLVSSNDFWISIEKFKILTLVTKSCIFWHQFASPASTHTNFSLRLCILVRAICFCPGNKVSSFISQDHSISFPPVWLAHFPWWFLLVIQVLIQMLTFQANIPEKKFYLKKFPLGTVDICIHYFDWVNDFMGVYLFKTF